MALLQLGLVAPLGVTADGETSLAGRVAIDGEWIVPAGQEIIVTNDLCLEADSIRIEGTLRLSPTESDAASVQLVARVSLSITGAVLGTQGASPAPTIGLMGTNGGDGSSIVLQGETLWLGDAAKIAVGNGGAGGDAAPLAAEDGATVRGGDGGSSGRLVLLGPVTHVPSYPTGLLQGGNGGPGGRPINPGGKTTLVGGSGGDGGGILSDQTAQDLAGLPRPVLPVDHDVSLTEMVSCGQTHSPLDAPDGGEIRLRAVMLADGGCDGDDGAPADASSQEDGSDGDKGEDANPGDPFGGDAQDGSGGGKGGDAGSATGGDGGDGCWGGNGGDGGDAVANGAKGGIAGDGGVGGNSNLVGGAGGNGGRGGDGGAGGTAKGGRPGCGGFAGRPGAPGTATAAGGPPDTGGDGGQGGNGLVRGRPGLHGTAGTPGTPGMATTQPECTNTV